MNSCCSVNRDACLGLLHGCAGIPVHHRNIAKLNVQHRRRRSTGSNLCPAIDAARNSSITSRCLPRFLQMRPLSSSTRLTVVSREREQEITVWLSPRTKQRHTGGARQYSYESGGPSGLGRRRASEESLYSAKRDI